MKRIALAVMAAAILTTAGLSAQQTSFAGKWTQVVDPAAAPPAGGGGGGRGGGRGGMGGGLCGPECTITQDATTLTVLRGEAKTTYKLDGTESKNSTAMGQMTMESTSVAKWDGAKLVVTTKQMMQEMPIEFKYTLSVTGAELTVERTGGREGMPAQTLKYKKS